MLVIYASFIILLSRFSFIFSPKEVQRLKENGTGEINEKK